MNKLKVHLSAVFYQQTSVTLSNNKYYFDFLWSEINSAWIYSIYDFSKKPIVQGRTLCLGVDLFKDISNRGQLIIEGDIPNRFNLGTLSNLFYYEGY